MRSLSVAATGMMAQQLHVEVISNNIANMTTTGYKRRRAEFQDLLYQNQRRIGSTVLGRGHRGAGRRAAGPGRQDGRRLPDPRPGRVRQHREQLRPGDPGQRLFRRRAAQRRARLHPLGQFPAQPRGPARHARRLHGEPGRHGAGGRGRGLDQPGGPGLGQDRRPGRGAGAGPAAARDLRQRGRPGGHRQQSAAGDRGLGPGAWPGRPAPRGWAPCCRASSRARTSTRCRRSPP